MEYVMTFFHFKRAHKKWKTQKTDLWSLKGTISVYQIFMQLVHVCTLGKENDPKKLKAIKKGSQWEES